jgi:hypothetical protein
VPGKALGKVNLGMSHEQVEGTLGSPTKEQPGAWLEYNTSGSTMDLFFEKDRLTEIRFNSKLYKTADGISLSTFSSRKYQTMFDYSRLQTRFMCTRQILKSGGFAIYKLNIDSADKKSSNELLGLVFGDRPVHEPISIEGARSNGWSTWDGSGSTLWDNIEAHGEEE